MDEDTTTITWEDLAEGLLGEANRVSPYRLAGLTSQLVGRYVREQVVYAYVRQALIPAHRNSSGKWVVDREHAATWMAKYAANAADRGAGDSLEAATARLAK